MERKNEGGGGGCSSSAKISSVNGVDSLCDLLLGVLSSSSFSCGDECTSLEGLLGKFCLVTSPDPCRGSWPSVVIDDSQEYLNVGVPP